LPNGGIKTGGATGGSAMLTGATTIASGMSDWTLENATGYVYAYTYVEPGGTGSRDSVPYYQIDVKIEGV
jgi:hypothetical protein